MEKEKQEEIVDSLLKASDKRIIYLFFYLTGWCSNDNHFWEGIQNRIDVINKEIEENVKQD